MDEIKTALASPLWWLTTFVFAFLVNAFTPWFLGKMGALTQRIGDKRRIEAEKRNAEFARMVRLARTDLRALVHLAALAAQERSLALRFLLVAAIALCTALLAINLPPRAKALPFSITQETMVELFSRGGLVMAMACILLANLVLRRVFMYQSALRQARISTEHELEATHDEPPVTTE